MRSALDLDATLADTISPGSEWIEIGGAAQARDELPERLPVLARARQLAGAHAVAAASATACCWRACSRCRPTCWCSTSRPTTSTSTRSSCSRSCCRATPARCSWSATTGASSTTSSPARSPGKATSRPGRWREYEGGYEDWKLQRERARGLRCRPRRAARRRRRPRRAGAPPRRRAAAKPRKLSYKEQRELDELPARIEALEAEQKELAALLAQRRLLRRATRPRVEQAQMRVAQIDDELMEALERWELLGSR